MAGTHDGARLRETLASILKEHAGLRLPSIADAVLFAILRAICARFGENPSLTPQALLEVARGECECAETVRRLLLESFTNKSAEFFRDKRIFSFLVEALLKKSEQKETQKEIVVWCPACSTGQEALSLAMTWQKRMRNAHEGAQKNSQESLPRLVVYASDLSEKAVETARSGRYNNFDVQHGLNVYDLLDFFEEQPDGGFWNAKADLLAHITFFQHNLLHAPPAFLPRRFDAILLPHTLQNFYAVAAEGICARLVSLLAPDGWLLLAPNEAEICTSLLSSDTSSDTLSDTSSLSSDAVPKGVFSRQDFRTLDCTQRMADASTATPRLS